LRFGLFVKKTRRNAPFIVAPPCQSDIKRTLRRGSPLPKTAYSRDFPAVPAAHSIQMVNDRFPFKEAYGFEMVDAPNVPFCGEIPHQLKIYTESNQSDFPRIFAELISMQTLAIYRRLVLQGLIARDQAQRDQTRRLGSRDVFSAPHGVLARACARAAAEGQDA
jgi:hypothetical protein